MAKRTRKTAADATKSDVAPKPARRGRTAKADKAKSPDQPEQKELAESRAAIEAGKDQLPPQSDEERKSLEQRLEKLERESADNAKKARESEDEVVRLKMQLAGQTTPHAPIPMRATALDLDKSKAQLRDIWPRDSDRLPAAMRFGGPVAKTFLVTPLGENIGNMAPAVISNCADEGDAKREYFAKTGATAHKIMVKVEPFGETKKQYDEQEKAFEEMRAAPVDEIAEFRAFQTQRRGAKIPALRTG